MKKVFTFIVLLFMSGIVLSQVKQRNDGNTLSSVKIVKEVNNIQSDAKAIVDSLHYDGPNADGIGTGAAANFGVYAFFPASLLSAHNALGNDITSVKVYINGVTDVTSAELRFYSDQGTTLVYNQSFVPIEGWNNVVLTTAFAIPATDLYIGYYLFATGGYPAGCDAGPVNQNGNWIDFGGAWQHLTDLVPTLTYNWNIRAMVDGTALTTPVASCTPLSWNAGSVVTSNSATSGTFTLTNVGGGTLTSSSITGVSAPFTCTFVPASVNLTAGQTATFTFTYSPTVVGVDNQTAVITTNGGNISISLTGTGIVCNTISSYPFTEGFEVNFPPDCWSLNDADGDGYNWYQNTAIYPHSGSACASSASWNGVPLTPDNYLITPQFNINNATLELKFWVAAQDPDYAEEHYAVMVSTTGTAAANFTDEVFTETLTSDTTWAQRTVSLSAYNGQNIYIAFRHHDVTDMFYFRLDDVTIDAAPTSPVASCTPLSWNAGNVPITTSVTSGIFTLSNAGIDTLTCSGITGLSAPYTTTLVPATVSLVASASATFTFTYNPTVVGANNQTVVIATNGGNITINLSGNGAVGINDNYFINGIELSQNQPNPATNVTLIQYEIQNNANVSLEIFDITGRLVLSYNEGKQMAGKHNILVDSDKLNKGTYYYSLKADNNRLTKKMIITQ